MSKLVGVALLAVAVAAVGVLLASRGDEHPYRVRAIFDNAGFVIGGEDVKVAGVKVGRIAALDVTPDFKAAVTLQIDSTGYQDFRRDATCIVRPQSLIGERFVECKPTQARSANASPPPPLGVIRSGPGTGDRLLPVSNTMQSVDIDLIGDMMREPERERLSLILNELGTGLAGRGKDLNDVIRRANPALQQTDRVLGILAEQNTALAQLATNSDAVLAPLARERAHVAGAIRNSSTVAKATAERRQDLEADIKTLPPFLDELKPTLARLGSLADESTPVLGDLGARADDINAVVRRLGPFSQAAIPAVDSLGEAARSGTQAVTDARPVIADLRGLAAAVRPVGATLRPVLESLRDTGGIERAMDYIYYQISAINGFDALGHYLRAELIVNQCATYAIEPVAGCSANFTQSASSSAVASAANATGGDPVLAATARALAKALGQEVDKADRQAKAQTTTPARHKPAAKREPHRRKASEPGLAFDLSEPSPDATPTPVPAATPAAPAPAPTEVAAAAATPDPADALLDYLFGSDGQ